MKGRHHVTGRSSKAMNEKLKLPDSDTLLVCVFFFGSKYHKDSELGIWALDVCPLLLRYFLAKAISRGRPGSLMMPRVLPLWFFVCLLFCWFWSWLWNATCSQMDENIGDASCLCHTLFYDIYLAVVDTFDRPWKGCGGTCQTWLNNLQLFFSELRGALIHKVTVKQVKKTEDLLLKCHPDPLTPSRRPFQKKYSTKWHILNGWKDGRSILIKNH